MLCSVAGSRLQSQSEGVGVPGHGGGVGAGGLGDGAVCVRTPHGPPPPPLLPPQAGAGQQGQTQSQRTPTEVAVQEEVDGRVHTAMEGEEEAGDVTRNVREGRTEGLTFPK